MGMVVGSREKKLSVPRGASGRAWVGLGSASFCMADTRQEARFPFCGETTLRTKRRAARSYRSSGHARPPPPWVWALPTVSSAGDADGVRLAPLGSLLIARRSYLHPGPTTLHCYRAPRREDKSDTEETILIDG